MPRAARRSINEALHGPRAPAVTWEPWSNSQHRAVAETSTDGGSRCNSQLNRKCPNEMDFDEGNMKSTSRKFLVGCGAAFLLFSASAQAVIYQAENYNAFNDTTAGNTGG